MIVKTEADLFLREMLPVQLAARGADGEKLLLQTGHITLNQGNAEVKHRIWRRWTAVDETLRDIGTRFVYDEVASKGFGDGEREHRGEDERECDHRGLEDRVKILCDAWRDHLWHRWPL